MQPNMQPSSQGISRPVVVSGADVSPQQKVLRNTYLLLALSMVPTGIGALIGVNMSFGLLRSSPIMGSLAILAIVYGMFFAIEKNRNNGFGVALLLGLTLFLGIILGPLLQAAIGLRNGGQLVAMAAGGTAIVFFAMSGIGANAKRDFGFMANFLMVGAIVIMLAVVANIFFASPVLHLTLCGAFVLFSSLLIMFQVNQIVRGGETSYVSATLTLYMSIYNLFSSLLQLLMALTGERD